MSIKLKKTSIVLFVINLMVLLDYNFFHLIQQPVLLQSVNARYIKVLIAAFAIILFAWVLIMKPRLRKKYYFCYQYLIMTIVCLLTLTLVSTIRYTKQPFYNAAALSSHYYIILLAFPLLYLLEMGYTEKKLLFYLEKFVFIWYVVCVVQYFYYFATGTSFLIGYFGGDSVLVRGESIRISLTALGNIAIIYHWEKILTSSKGKIWSVVNVVIGLFCVFFIQQTRMYYVADGIALLVVLLLCGKKVNVWLRNMAIFFVAILLLFATGLPMQFLNSFLVGNETYSIGSTTIRIAAIIYYGGQILTNPLTGIGFASDDFYYSLVHGSTGQSYYSDLGLFGVVANMGFLGFLIYILPICRMGFICFQIFKRKKLSEYSLLVALLIYCVTSSISLSFVTAVNIFVLPWIIALFEYKWKYLKRHKTRETKL